ncbi:hypothetical protein D9M72_563770 [compost metagenome]
MNYLAPMACQAFPESCPYAAAIVGVINSAHQIVGIANNGSDDYIGSYTIRITNTNGMLFTFGYGVDRCNYFNQFVNSANNDLRTVQQVRLVGDGSNYQMFTQSTYF